ncbi:uncharacterized protein LOC111242130 [Vigna radiata var. radiata]|uniref:Uncharacterized protein LOC111242130 n=1 Tax=Vigna radiata var. radiata TaxID=3916 RepID=A0A3Q0F9B2_VIGRR|nr:uncharacterized protein LOC111242130 [Vigna radiata var. radiata]
MSGSSSSCKCTGWGFQQSSGGGSRLGAKPSCYCGSKAVFRIAKTPKNKGKRFWGCPHFKGGSEDIGGCNFFKWCNEEVIDERNVVILEERSASARNDEVGGSMMKMEERDVEKLKLASLEKSLVILEKGMKLLIGMMFVTCLFNVIVISMLMKVG